MTHVESERSAAGTGPRRAKAAEVVARQMTELIVGQGLGDGDRLPNESELIERFGVARATVREGLRLLEAQGVLRIRAGRSGGPVVRTPSPEDLSGSLTLLLQCLAVPFREVVLARELIEPLVASEAARRVTPRDLRWFADNLEDQRAAVGDDADFLAHNDAFHRRLATIAANPVLELVAASLEGITASLDTPVRYPTATQARIIKAHQRIVGALEAGDPEAAGQSGHEHVAEFRRFVERHDPGLLDQPIRWLAAAPG